MVLAAGSKYWKKNQALAAETVQIYNPVTRLPSYLCPLLQLPWLHHKDGLTFDKVKLQWKMCVSQLLVEKHPPKMIEIFTIQLGRCNIPIIFQPFFCVFCFSS